MSKLFGHAAITAVIHAAAFSAKDGAARLSPRLLDPIAFETIAFATIAVSPFFRTSKTLLIFLISLPSRSARSRAPSANMWRQVCASILTWIARSTNTCTWATFAASYSTWMVNQLNVFLYNTKFTIPACKCISILLLPAC
jgi:hypothetical protein